MIGAEFVLIPMRTRQWFPEWSGTVAPFTWWAIGLVILWVAVPAWLLKRDGPLPFSIALPRTGRGLALYGALIAVMIPALLLASKRPDFLNTYPLLHPIQPAGWTAGLLAAYWLCYATILFSTEFLFRGVLLFGLESRLGYAAIGVSVLPYCLIHVAQATPRSVWLHRRRLRPRLSRARTRSIGGGVLVHCAVAFGMDTMALIGNGVFFS